MKKQAFFLLFLLVIHSPNLNSQPKTKTAYDGLFGRSRNQVFDKSEEQVYDLGQEKTDQYSPKSDVNIYAVVVGVSQYTAMPPLHYTDDDARLFYRHLRSNEGGALPANQITLLLEEDASYQNIRQALRQMAQRADENDVIIFYFSGHGVNRAFLPFDFDGYENQLSHEEVFQILQNSQARHKLCIADACYSGTLDYSADLTSKGYVSSSRLKHEYEMAQSGIALLMSSSPGEASLEDRALHQGIFTYFLVHGLSGAADYNYDGIVNIKEIFRYVSYKVNAYTNGAQSPSLIGDYDSDLPVSIGE